MYDNDLGVFGSQVDVVFLEEGDLGEVAGEEALFDRCAVGFEGDFVFDKDL